VTLGEKLFKKYALCAVIAAAPSLAPAATVLDKALMCHMTATDFFTPLAQRGLMEMTAYSIEDSINYFHVTQKHQPLKKDSGTVVFGLPVEAVFGYIRGQLLFRRSPGTEPADMYGVVVRDGIGNVRATLDSVGARDAKVRRIDNRTTEIICEGT
jgi:hypothetical protein